MTEDQKQALIEWLKEGIELREEYGFNGNLLASMRVALAALTAPEDWKQRAEAAEAKLAELEKPQHKTCDACIDVLGSLGFNYKTAKLKDVLDEVKKLRSAPAVSLAELVEDEATLNAGVNALIDCLEDCGDAEQGLRLALRAILRNIEEAK